MNYADQRLSAMITNDHFIHAVQKEPHVERAPVTRVAAAGWKITEHKDLIRPNQPVGCAVGCGSIENISPDDEFFHRSLFER